MEGDSEISAMSQISKSLSELDPETTERVLRWAAERFKVNLFATLSKTKEKGGTDTEGTQDFEDFGSLFNAANPQTASSKALVAGFWFQIVQAQTEFTSQQLNTELKQLGHGSLNITRDLTELIEASPRLVIQTRKEGKGKQARKKYKVTAEGLATVRRMLAPPSEEG